MRTVVRLFILTSIVSVAAFAAVRAQAQNASATGVIRVTAKVQDTQEPFAGLSVTLTGRSTAAVTATVSTGPDGVAVFDKLRLESYDVRVAGIEGYLIGRTSPTAVNTAVPAGAMVVVATNIVASPQSVEVPVLLLTAGSVSGRVLDSYGVPIPSARVIAGVIGYTDGRRTFQQQATAQPDGNGNYVLTPRMESGEYYLRLETAQLQGMGTYYPGVPNIGSAVKIPVHAGQQVVGIDFNAANPKTYKVNGNVLDLPTRMLPNGQPDVTVVPSFSFVPADPGGADPQASPLIPNGRRGSDGEFEISLPAGLWDIFPVVGIRALNVAPAPIPAVSAPPAISGAPMYATGRARVLISDRDIENVSITIAATDIKGQIIVDGDAQLPALNSMRLSLIPAENFPSPLVSHLRTALAPATDGSFTLGSVPPGRYNLNLTSIPTGYYLGDLRIGIKSIFDSDIIEVGSDPLEPLSITLRRGGGSVQVRIPVPTAPANRRIVLVPEDPRQQNPLLYKLNQGLAFTMTSFSDVPPGDYKLFAFENLPGGGAERNDEFMAKYQNFAKSIHVEAGQTTTVDVEWIPAGQ